jgi:RNA polymerase sigma factor (sigma-70 family)
MTHGQKEEILFEESKEFLELIDQCKKQNSDALERFFELYSIDIYNFPIKVFQFSEEEAGDFFLFAFERLRDGKRFKTFRGESSFKTWFYSVLRNLVMDWIRANKKSKVLQFYHYGSLTEVENEIFDELKSEDQIESNQIKNLFYQTIDSFDEESRIIFKLVYIFYLNLDERDIQILKDKYHKSGYEIFKFVLETKEYLVNKKPKIKPKKRKTLSSLFKFDQIKGKRKRIKKVFSKPFFRRITK